MTAKPQYDGRLYSQAEVDRMIVEAAGTAVVAVKQDIDELTRCIAALLLQSGGVATISKRTLTALPRPADVKFNIVINTDDSVTLALTQDEYMELSQALKEHKE